MECTNIYDSEIDTAQLYQGDIFRRFDNEFEKPILPKVKPPEIAFMVLNYTCDLIDRKDLSNIFLCPILKIDVIIAITLEGLKLKYPKRSKDKIINQLKQLISDILNYKKKFVFFLTKIPEFEGSHAVADLLRTTSIPVEYFNNILRNKIKSLKSPWREKLGWKIGYIFNRVGLPDTTTSSVEDYVRNHSVIRNYLDERLE